MPTFCREIPSLGPVTLRHVTMGAIADAQKLADKADVNTRPIILANAVLSAMFTEPTKTADDVAALPDDAVALLVEAAIDSLGARKEFEETAPAQPARQRFYLAYLEHHHVFLGKLASSLTFNAANVLEQVVDKNTQALRQAILPPVLLKNISDGALQMIALNASLADFAFPKDSFLASEELRRLQETIGKVWTEPLRKTIAGMTQVRIPEPFLSDTLITSGLNSPMLHSPSYTLPTIRPICTADDIQTRAEDVQRDRLVDAFDTIVHLEQTLRKLVEAKLRGLHGDHWWKQGVPESVRKECERFKQEKEKSMGTTYSPIYYAYINDYKAIVVKSDNWDKAFRAIFYNKSEAEVSLTRVGRIRNSVAHSRPISDDEYKMLVVEARWLQAAIARAGGVGEF